MKRTSLLCLMGILCIYGCHTKKEVLRVGYVPGPFFHYGQSSLSESRHFDLGDISPSVSTITAAIAFSNRGREPLVIEKVVGLNSSFSGWEGDRHIAPGQKGIITVRFDKDKLKSDPAVQSVLVRTNDPANQTVTFFFGVN